MGKQIFYLVLHAFLWLVLLGGPYMLFKEESRDVEFNMLLSQYYWLFSLSFGALFYANFYLLIPKLYCKEKYWQYAISVLLLFVFFYVLKPFFLLFKEYLIRSGVGVEQGYSMRTVDGVSLILFIIVVSVGMAIRMVMQWRDTEKRALKAEAEKTNAELSFLKAQVNPHFLFNTLNNIYSLSVDNHPDTSDSIMKLSNIMRYITDDATSELVLLENEIECIRNYVDLQQLRLHTNIRVDFAVSGNPEHKLVTPLILITYIENAFKYGISSRGEAVITIKLAIQENEVDLFCQNKIFIARQVKERTGIGLTNNKQRLKNLYQDKYQAVITQDNGFYTVEQSLPLRNEA